MVTLGVVIVRYLNVYAVLLADNAENLNDLQVMLNYMTQFEN